MRRSAMAWLLSGLSVLILSCASIPRYVDPVARGDPRFLVRVWVEPGLSADDARAGCEIWREKGVACRMVDEPEDADIRVSADPRPCVANEDGRRTLAEAWQGGRVVFYTACFASEGGFDRHQFRAVMGHEVGHEIGIWEHVPPECDDHALRHPGGARVCGRALMIPLYDKDVSFMTPVDGLAFDVRDPMISVLIDVADKVPEPEGPSCVYRTR